MDTMEAMRARHSVRQYNGKPIEGEALAKLQELIDWANTEGNLHIQYITGTEKVFSGMVKTFCGWKDIPGYLAMVGPDTPDLNHLLGYYGEHIVIEAQKMGLNTCWAGMFKKKHVTADIAPGERLVLVIAIGYGETQGKERPSKSAPQVSVVNCEAPDWFNAGVECALIAPTAVNQQKFTFTLNADETVALTCDKGPHSETDMGIVRYHFEFASGHKVQVRL